MQVLVQQLGFALRQLRRNPGFTVSVVVTLALAVGANTAIFSILNALLLKRLPYRDPERMGTIFTRIAGPASSDERHHLNGEQWELLRDNVPAVIPAISGIGASGVNLEAGSRVKHIGVPGVRASALGLLLGFILCAGALRVMHSVVYGIGVYDLPAMVSVLLVLASVTLAASTVPTPRIARIDPAETLREE